VARASSIAAIMCDFHRTRPSRPRRLGKIIRIVVVASSGAWFKHIQANGGELDFSLERMISTLHPFGNSYKRERLGVCDDDRM
jgi:hypothetical protein